MTKVSVDMNQSFKKLPERKIKAGIMSELQYKCAVERAVATVVKQAYPVFIIANDIESEHVNALYVKWKDVTIEDRRLDTTSTSSLRGILDNVSVPFAYINASHRKLLNSSCDFRTCTVTYKVRFTTEIVNKESPALAVATVAALINAHIADRSFEISLRKNVMFNDTEASSPVTAGEIYDIMYLRTFAPTPQPTQSVPIQTMKQLNIVLIASVSAAAFVVAMSIVIFSLKRPPKGWMQSNGSKCVPLESASDLPQKDEQGGEIPFWSLDKLGGFRSFSIAPSPSDPTTAAIPNFHSDQSTDDKSISGESMLGRIWNSFKFQDNKIAPDKQIVMNGDFYADPDPDTEFEHDNYDRYIDCAPEPDNNEYEYHNSDYPELDVDCDPELDDDDYDYENDENAEDYYHIRYPQRTSSHPPVYIGYTEL